MITLGVDLAAQPKNTYACAVDWSGGRARLTTLHRRLDDENLVRILSDESLTSIGVDVPFGWPVAFVEMMAGGGSLRSWNSDSERLRLRDTDRYCKRVARKEPLSVSSDRIAAPAMRWRMLGPRLASAKVRAREVYPAAALAIWKLEHTGYKARDERDARARILSAVRAALALDVSDADATCMADCADALDALVASLVARAVALGRVHPIPPESAFVAATEGWIELPTCSLGALLG